MLLCVEIGYPAGCRAWDSAGKISREDSWSEEPNRILNETGYCYVRVWVIRSSGCCPAWEAAPFEYVYERFLDRSSIGRRLGVGRDPVDMLDSI